MSISAVGAGGQGLISFSINRVLRRFREALQNLREGLRLNRINLSTWTEPKMEKKSVEIIVPPMALDIKNEEKENSK